MAPVKLLGMPSLTRTCLFVVSLIIFVLFFQGDYRRWHPLGQGGEGPVYEFDERSLRRVRPDVYHVLLRRRDQAGTVQEWFEVDRAGLLITNLTRGTAPEPIPPASIAAALRDQLYGR